MTYTLGAYTVRDNSELVQKRVCEAAGVIPEIHTRITTIPASAARRA